MNGDEIQAYYLTAKNTKLPQYQNPLIKNFEYGFIPIRTYFLKPDNNKALVSRYRKELEFLLTQITPGAAATLKSEIRNKTGINF